MLWSVYVATDNKAPGLVAFALLPIVGILGFLMFMTWLAGRGAVVERVPAEQKIPPLVVAAHGLFAVLTVLAVLVAVVS